MSDQSNSSDNSTDEQHSSRKHKRTKTNSKFANPSDVDFEVSESKESDSEEGDDIQEYRSNEISFKEDKGNYSLTINAGRKDINKNKDEKKISSLLMALTRTKAMSLLNLNAASKNKNEQEEVEFSETTGLTSEQLKKLKSTRCLFRYNAGWRIYWDLFMILLALYNCFVIPVQVAFDPPSLDNVTTTVIDALVDFLFGVDIFIMFRTTFLDTYTGEEIIDGKRIAINYLKGRFWFDFLATLPFDLIQFPYQKFIFYANFGQKKEYLTVFKGKNISIGINS